MEGLVGPEDGELSGLLDNHSSHSRISEEDQQYVAGFIDGDGCIELKYPDKSHPLPLPIITIAQSHNAGEPPELLYIQKHFGGRIYLVGKAKENLRARWQLRILVLTEVELLLGVMLKHGVVKSDQARYALEYLRKRRTNILESVEAIKSAKTNYQNIEIDSDRLTPAYLAGIFVAEGSVCLVRQSSTQDYDIRSNIAQASCVRFLYAIHEKIGFGSVNGGKINFACAQTIKLLEMIQPYLKDCQKKPQVEAILTFVATRTTRPSYKRTAKEIETMECVANELKKLKKQ